MSNTVHYLKSFQEQQEENSVTYASPQTRTPFVYKPKNPTCELFVIDDFFCNPVQMRSFIVTQEFPITGNFVGSRTKSYADNGIKDYLQRLLTGFKLQITDFCVGDDAHINGAFVSTNSRSNNWIHCDPNYDWYGLVFLTPEIPESSTISFYKFIDGTERHGEKSNETLRELYNKDASKWTKTDSISVKFNRLVLFNPKRFHMLDNIVGTNVENGLIYQMFAFNAKV